MSKETKVNLTEGADVLKSENIICVKECTYNDNNQLLIMKKFENGNLKFEKRKEYDDLGRETRMEIINGNTKTISDYTYTYNELITNHRIECNDGDVILTKSKKVFDKSTRTEFGFGSLGNDRLMYIKEFNEDSKLVRHILTNNKKKSKLVVIDYEYDTDGNLVDKYINNQLTIENEYDDNGNNIKAISHKAGSTTTFKYDDQNRVTEYQTIFNNGNVYTEEFVYSIEDGKEITRSVIIKQFKTITE